MRPGTACALNSVPRVPSNCSGLARFLKSSVPLIGAVDGHLPGDILQFDVGAAALQVDAPFDVRGADQVAAADIQADVAADAGEADVAVAAGDFDVAIDVVHLVIAVGAARFHRHAARHGDFQVVRTCADCWGCAILIGAHHQAIALRHDFHRRAAVGAVGVFAVDRRESVCGR